MHSLHQWGNHRWRCLGRRRGRAADDHRTNSPRSGQIQPHHLSV